MLEIDEYGVMVIAKRCQQQWQCGASSERETCMVKVGENGDSGGDDQRRWCGDSGGDDYGCGIIE